MSLTLEKHGLDTLSRDERMILVQELWDSIAAEPPRPISDARRAELARRAQEDDASPDEVVPWEEVKARSLARAR